MHVDSNICVIISCLARLTVDVPTVPLSFFSLTVQAGRSIDQPCSYGKEYLNRYHTEPFCRGTARRRFENAVCRGLTSSLSQGSLCPLYTLRPVNPSSCYLKYASSGEEIGICSVPETIADTFTSAALVQYSSFWV